MKAGALKKGNDSGNSRRTVSRLEQQGKNRQHAHEEKVRELMQGLSPVCPPKTASPAQMGAPHFALADEIKVAVVQKLTCTPAFGRNQ